VSLDSESVRNANAERQSRFRKSPAGKAAAARRAAALQEQRRQRRAYRDSRLHRAQSLSFDGRYSGPLTVGVPRIGDLKLSSFKGVSQ